MTEVIKLARELGKEIQKTEAYKSLTAAQIANDLDTDMQAMIGEFNLKRMNIQEEVAKEEKDNEKITALDTELKAMYATIMGNPNMTAYTNAKKDIDDMMNQVNAVLVMSVNGEDPETCDPNPPSSCGSGGCSSCSGCH